MYQSNQPNNHGNANTRWSVYVTNCYINIHDVEPFFVDIDTDLEQITLDSAEIFGNLTDKED